MGTGNPNERPATSNRSADILLVEDNAIDAQLSLRALKQCGLAHQVEHVSDGGEALDYIEAVNLRAGKPASLPKLILLDLGLHKIGGLHVLRQLKSDARTKSIPIVVLTSSQMAIEMVESYRLGVNSYVIKPSDAKKFTEVVAQVGHYWLAINQPPPQ
jgi:CheY-like chemotaxis protein